MVLIKCFMLNNLFNIAEEPHILLVIFYRLPINYMLFLPN